MSLQSFIFVFFLFFKWNLYFYVARQAFFCASDSSRNECWDRAHHSPCARCTRTLAAMLPSIHLLALWRRGCRQSWRRLRGIFCRFSMKRSQHTHTHISSRTFMLALSWLNPLAWAALQSPNQNKQTLSILSLLWSDSPQVWILNHSKKMQLLIRLATFNSQETPAIIQITELTFFSPTWLQSLLACHHCRTETEIADGQFNGRLPEAMLDPFGDESCFPQGDGDFFFLCGRWDIIQDFMYFNNLIANYMWKRRGGSSCDNEQRVLRCWTGLLLSFLIKLISIQHV